MSKSDRWTFTVPNPGEWRPLYNPMTMHYIIWEMEICPTTGTPHIQGYVRMKTRKMMPGMKAALHPTAHLEVAVGTEEQNRQYCSEEREQAGLDWAEEGTYNPEAGRRGRRTDLSEATQEIAQGVPIEQVAAHHPEVFVKYPNGLTSLALMIGPKPPVRRNVTTTVLWGKTGVGKSHRVRTEYPEAFVVQGGKDPFYGYTNQEVIVFEEFDPQEIKIRQMNLYLDVWTTMIPSRYHNKQPWWTTIFILSNSPSSTWYPMEPQELQAAFQRRIKYEIEVKSKEQEILFTH